MNTRYLEKAPVFAGVVDPLHGSVSLFTIELLHVDNRETHLHFLVLCVEVSSVGVMSVFWMWVGAELGGMLFIEVMGREGETGNKRKLKFLPKVVGVGRN